MTKKTILKFLILLSMLVTLSACYSGEDPIKEKNAAKSEETAKPKNDQD